MAVHLFKADAPRSLKPQVGIERALKSRAREGVCRPSSRSFPAQPPADSHNTKTTSSTKGLLHQIRDNSSSPSIPRNFPKRFVIPCCRLTREAAWNCSSSYILIRPTAHSDAQAFNSEHRAQKALIKTRTPILFAPGLVVTPDPILHYLRLFYHNNNPLVVLSKAA